MKKVIMMMSLVALATAAMAVPAKRGLWQTITLADGTQVKALLVGDEHGHYWHGDDGVAYIRAKGADYYVTVDAQQVASKAKARRAKVNEKRIQKRVFGHPTTILGQRRLLLYWQTSATPSLIKAIIKTCTRELLMNRTSARVNSKALWLTISRLRAMVSLNWNSTW